MKLAIRSMIRAAPGNILCAFDLAAAEAWVVAYLADEPNMKRELSQGDIHVFAACGIFGNIYILENPKSSVEYKQRYVGKKMNHAGNYRTGPYKIAEFINQEGIITISVAEAKVFHEKWLRTFNLFPWWNDIDERLSNNRTFTTEYGFRRKFWGIYGDDLKKEATAFEPQSTVADHMHGAVHPSLGIPGGNLEIYKKIVLPSKGEVKMINTSHDSVMLEVPRVMQNEILEHAASLLCRPLVIRGQQFTIPVDAEFGERWGEFESYKTFKEYRA